MQGITRSRLVPASALHLGERQLLAALRTADPSLKVELCYGLGAVRRISRGFAIPRDNPWLAAAAVCIEDDPSWAYPLLLSMGTGNPASPDLRKRWRTACRRGEM